MRRLLWLIAPAVLAAFALVTPSVSPPERALALPPQCTGPWSGVPIIHDYPSVAEVGIELDGRAETLTLYDTQTRVAQYPSQPIPGGQQIPIEIISMNLVGDSGNLGYGPVRLVQSPNPANRSLGCVIQTGPTPLDSFFDVFVELQQIGGPQQFFNTQPVPVQARLYTIPPLGQPYMYFGGGTGGGDRGIRLFDPSFRPRGNVNLVKHILEPRQTPSWTIDDAGPNAMTPANPGGPYHPADILSVPGAPVVSITCAGLGLAAFGAGCTAAAAQNNLDALSYGRDFSTTPNPVGYVGFSVRRGAAGIAGTAVAVEAACGPPEPETDEFGTILNGSNYQIFDGNGVPCGTNAGPPIMPPNSESGPPHDDLDGIDQFPPALVDPNVDGDIFDAGDRPVYFSLAAGSPVLGPIGATRADVLSNGPTGGAGNPPSVYRSETALGLAPGGPLGDDDIDGICLRDSASDEVYALGTDVLVYSLAAGSPSLTNGNVRDWFGAPVIAHPGDLIYDNFGTPVVIDEESALGLLATDDLDAVKCVKSMIDMFADPTNSVITAPDLTTFNPSATPTITQNVGSVDTYNVFEVKQYVPPGPFAPPEMIAQADWTVCRLSGVSCVTADPDVYISWAWDPGDQCTHDTFQFVCPVLAPPQNTNDLHFNHRLIQGSTHTLKRNFRVTCQTPGTYTMHARLEQHALGQDATRQTDDHLTFQWTLVCNAPPTPDTDGDGCSDVEESATGPGQEQLGGNRNPNDYFDWYDVDPPDPPFGPGNDRFIDLQDTLLILQHFGHGPNDDPLDNDLDRYRPNMATPWATAAGNDGIDLIDALASLSSFGHDCSAPP